MTQKEVLKKLSESPSGILQKNIKDKNLILDLVKNRYVVRETIKTSKYKNRCWYNVKITEDGKKYLNEKDFLIL